MDYDVLHFYSSITMIRDKINHDNYYILFYL